MLSALRKTKMNMKKNTSKPFYTQAQRADMPMFQPPNMFVPNFYAQQQIGVQNIVNKQILPQEAFLTFTSISDLQKNKGKFLALPEAEKTTILKNHILLRLHAFKSLVDVFNKKQRRRKS